MSFYDSDADRLAMYGAQAFWGKIDVIKILRAFVPMGLKDAKNIVEAYADEKCIDWPMHKVELQLFSSAFKREVYKEVELEPRWVLMAREATKHMRAR